MPPGSASTPRSLAPRVGGRLRAASRGLKLTLTLGLLAAVVVVAVGSRHWVAGRTQRATLAGWRKFDEAARTADAATMNAALDEVLAADPAEPTALARRAALATGVAPDGDAALTAFLLRQQFRDGDIPAAARSAAQLLRHRPKDWLALCVTAADALRRGDRAAALLALDALPGPGEEGANVEAVGLLVAFRLHDALERDPSRLRGFVQSSVCPLLKAGTVQSLNAADKLALVACYLEGFEPPTGKPQPPPLPLAWTPANTLLDSAAEEATAAGSAPLLRRAGGLSAGLVVAAATLRAAEQVTAAQAADFTRDGNARTRRCYVKLAEVDPAAAEAYRGLARLAADAGRYEEARAEVARGLSHCGDDPELSALFGRMLQLEGRAAESYGPLRELARREPTQAAWWGLAVTAAVAANRADLALADCAAMRAALPGHLWAAKAEARLWLDAGDAARAAQLLHPLGSAALAKDAEGARLYARSLEAAGLHALVPDFLAAVEKAAHDSDDPAPLAAALRGQLEARPDAVAAERLAAECQRFAGRWPDAGDFPRLRAEALHRAAEASAPDWEAAKVAAAIRAAERWRARAPGDRAAAVMLVTLRLRAGDAAQASRDAAPLRDAEADPCVTAAELEALGAAHLADGRLADAARVLGRLSRSSSARPGVSVQLALVYLAQRKLPEARAALALAQTLPRSPQEQADYAAAARQLLQESP